LVTSASASRPVVAWLIRVSPASRVPAEQVVHDDAVDAGAPLDRLTGQRLLAGGGLHVER
jgi:hypothetical protein